MAGFSSSKTYSYSTKNWVPSGHTPSFKGYHVQYLILITALCRGYQTSHVKRRELRAEKIRDKSLASALMAGKSISGWNYLALSPWASCYVMWLFSPKGSEIFWAKAFMRKTNLLGGWVSNKAQTLKPLKWGGIKYGWANSFLVTSEQGGVISIAG